MNRDRSHDLPKTAAQLMAELSSDAGFVASESRRGEEIAHVARRAEEAGQPIVANLQAAGLSIISVGELLSNDRVDRRAIPILIAWLPKVDNPASKETIVRALSVPSAKPIAAAVLIEEFRKADDDGEGTGLRWVIANALEVVADDSVYDEIRELATNRRFGKSREMLALAIGNMKTTEATAILIELLSDDVTVGHAVRALGNRKATEAKEVIEKLLSHPKAWVRKEAQSALAKLSR